MKDYYHILNIPKTASEIEIKKAFIGLAVKLHPDKNKEPDAHEKFIEINEAFQILSDKEKRRKYDSVYDTYVLNKKQETPNSKEEREMVEDWGKSARKKSEEYADSDYEYYLEEILFILKHNPHGLIKGIGDLIEDAGDLLDDLFSDD